MYDNKEHIYHTVISLYPDVIAFIYFSLVGILLERGYLYSNFQLGRYSIECMVIYYVEA